MPQTNLTGNDTLVVNNRVIQGFTDGSTVDLAFPNKVAALKIGKNRNAIFAENTTGYVCEFKLRLLRRGPDDVFFLNLYNSQTGGNFAGFTLLQGAFTKQIGDGAGNILYDKYTLKGGIFVSAQPAISNPEGNTEQNTVMYELMFASALRASV